MMLTDVHNHTAYSSDGRVSAEEMLATAYSLGVKYYGVADHFNFDYLLNDVRKGFTDNITRTPENYFTPMRKLQAEYVGKMKVLVGGEFGFTRNEKSNEMGLDIVERFKPDFVVNSVHTIGRYDYCEAKAYLDEEGNVKDKKTVYNEYFQKVRDSLDVPYRYDIVAHCTYCTRYAPYADKRVDMRESGDIIDDILTTIISRGKILEINSANKGAPDSFIPCDDVVRRYYELGGRMVSFASDAHVAQNIIQKRNDAVEFLKSIGFKYLTVPCQNEYIEVEL